MLSNSYQLQGGMMWKQDSGLQSEHYQLVQESPAPAPATTTSGGNETGGGGGNGGGGKRGAGEVLHPSAQEHPSAPSPQKTAVAKPVPSQPVVILQPAAPSTSTRVATHIPSERQPSSIPRNAPEKVTPQTPVAVTNIFCITQHTLGCLSVAEGGIMVRLSTLYRFESVYSGIPAYQSLSASVVSLRPLLAVRPGFVSIEGGLLFPLGLLRRRRHKQGKKNDALS